MSLATLTRPAPALVLTTMMYSAAASAAENADAATRHTSTPVSIALLMLAALAVIAALVVAFQLVRFRTTGRTRDA